MSDRPNIYASDAARSVSERKALIDALRLGEIACLNMIIFEPITSQQSKWDTASNVIKQEREKLERDGK